MKMNKLYRVNMKGFSGSSYVVAKDETSAYRKVRKFLDDNDLGFRKDRALKSIELIGEDKEYPECGTRLFL